MPILKALLLADYARIEAGKLYVLGGLVDRIWTGALPTVQALTLVAVVEFVPTPIGPITVEVVIDVADPAGRSIATFTAQSMIQAPTDSADLGSLLTPIVLTLPCLFEVEGVHVVSVTLDDQLLGALPLAVSGGLPQI